MPTEHASHTSSLDQALRRVELRRALPDPARIRLIRQAAGLTQAEVGAAVGVTQETVSKWESGDATPSNVRLAALIDVLLALVDAVEGARR